MVWDTPKQRFVTSIHEKMCTSSLDKHHCACMIFASMDCLKNCVIVEFAATVNGQSLSKVGGSSQGHEITLNT